MSKKKSIRFESKRSFGLGLVFMLTLALVAGLPIYSFIYSDLDSTAHFITVLICVPLAMVMMDAYMRTFYLITDEELIVRCSFFRKKIPLKDIRRVEQQRGIYSGLKFGLSFKGYVVHYNKFDELFISPANEDEFLKQIGKDVGDVAFR